MEQPTNIRIPSEQISIVTFGHGEVNVLGSEALSALSAKLEQIAQTSASFIVLESAGNRAFCAGADLDEFSAATTEEEYLRIFAGFARVANAIRTAPQIVIARVHGKAVGGGVGLAACCDFAIATPDASVKLSELAFGIGPYVIGPAVERKIGLGHFSTLSLTTEFCTSDWARTAGLYQQVVESPEELDPAINAFIARLTKASIASLSAWKRALWHDTEHWAELLPSRARQVALLALQSRNAQIRV